MKIKNLDHVLVKMQNMKKKGKDASLRIYIPWEEIPWVGDDHLDLKYIGNGVFQPAEMIHTRFPPSQEYSTLNMINGQMDDFLDAFYRLPSDAEIVIDFSNLDECERVLYGVKETILKVQSMEVPMWKSPCNSGLEVHAENDNHDILQHVKDTEESIISLLEKHNWFNTEDKERLMQMEKEYVTTHAMIQYMSM